MADGGMRARIGDDMRAAMKERDQVKVGTLRMLMTAIKNTEVEKIHELSDEETLDVIAKEAKRRRESIDAYGEAGRTDLVDKETAELRVLEAYLPERMSEDELAKLVDEAVAESGASSPKQMGDVMKILMPKLRGRADGGQVSALVKAKLGA
ncbi:MAG: GatB/YqeY domain-containing protein [Actinomycetota bacterium]|nr:GatB/YqeY domain-containing protein [Actinomycetota bacterium]